MRKPVLLLLLALGLVRCTDTPKNAGPAALNSPAASATLRGYYILGNEVNMLRNCADNKQYWVRDSTGMLDSLYTLACAPSPIPYEAVYAVLTGTPGPKEADGYASEADGTFTVTRVDTLEAKTMFNACLPFEFWCHGTEPFWSLQISEAEGGIFLKNMADEAGAQYTWTEPQTDGSTSWVYQTDNGSDPLTIRIKKAPCSDGMSEMEYQYSVQVVSGDRKLSGCAVRGGEPVSRPNY